ncbi:MAG: choice-of-anchor J domain-containing protein [Paramuribaculum sp.]|nr:choice-of-anchor J domain-containing protein [Paramuribaculum sp.]
MNKLKSIFGLMLAAVLCCGALSSCQDDIDAPSLEVPVATLKPNTTIAEVKEKFWQDGDNYIASIGEKDNGEHYVISGRVISSDRSGNIYKSLVIQDETAALAISINQSNLYNEYRVGQEIVMDLTGMYIGKYASLQQLGYPSYDIKYGDQATFMAYALFRDHSQLNGLPEPNKVNVLDVNISDLGNSKDALLKYQSQLVRLHNVTFDEGGKATFCTAHKENTNRTIKDANNVSLTVRTSGYANFWATKLPEGPVDLIGIVSTYNGSWQLVLRSLDDILGVDTKGMKDNPYDVLDALNQIATGQNVGKKWYTGYIVGTVKPEVTTVSSVDDLQFDAPFIINNTLVIGQSADSRSLDACMIVRLPQESALREYGNLRENPTNLGKQIWLQGVAGSEMNTNAITQNTGSVDEFKIEGVETGGGSVDAGNGTEESPYNVSQVVAMGKDANEADKWMAGYIVGWVDNSKNNGQFADETNCMFTTPATSATNVLMADNATETDWTKCVVVNLPNTDNIRASVNLVDNPTNLGRKIVFHGTVRKYFSMPGFRDLLGYKWLDGGDQPDQPDEPGAPVTSLDESFPTASIPAGWKVVTTSGNRNWQAGSFSGNNFVSCTGYNGTPGTNGFESWFISPAVNINEVTKKVLSFTTAAGYSGSGNMEVYVLSSNDPTTAQRTKLNAKVATPPGTGYTAFEPSGDVSLSSFSGVIYIGFRFYAEASSSYVTIQLDDIKLGEGGSEPENPDQPTDPTNTTSADFNTFNNGAATNAYGDYTSADGWKATWCAISQGGGDNVNSMIFPFLGEADVMGVVIDGSTKRPGSLVSPLLANGCKTLTFKYGFAFNETKGVQFDVNVKQNGAVKATKRVTVPGPVTKGVANEFSMDVNVTGDFTIEIVNDATYANSTNNNACRVCVWDLKWTR